ncbi:MAG: hypothetical protein ACK5CG_03040, partial [Aphanizomenon sp.]
MFISIDQIRDSLKYLEKVDSFWGITFLKFKQLQLPVGNTIKIDIDSEIKDFVRNYYKPCKDSTFSYRCFRLSKKQNRWMKLNQSLMHLIREKIFIEALIDEIVLIDQILEEELGWKDNYIEVLKSSLYDNQLI